MNTGKEFLIFLKDHTIIFHIIKEPARIIMGIPKVYNIVKEGSYYTEYKRKNTFRRVLDNFYWLFKYHEPNKFYNLYGLDVKDRGQLNDYQDYFHFRVERDKLNHAKSANSQIILLRDKRLFSKYMEACGFTVPRVFTNSLNGALYDADMNRVDDSYLSNKVDYFVKEANGECASFVLHIRDFQDYLAHKDEIIKRNCIFQDRVIQCEYMNKINPFSVNTLRIVTVNKKGAPYVMVAELRIGTSKTGPVDNAAAGGVMVGINEDGTLKKYGFMKPGYGGRCTAHPDSNIIFADVQIPNWDAIVKLVCAAHKQYYNIHSIGWDIALSEDGPIFIEGNDNWEISGVQSCNGGLKKEWNSAIS